MKLNFKSLVFVVCVLAGVANRVWGGPPFVTDDPEPVDYQHWELYLFSTYFHSSTYDTGTFPAVEVNYGVIPDVQLHLIPQGAYDRVPGGHAHFGLGDTELGVKYRFIHETDTLPQVGTFPLFEIPTGSERRGLGNGQSQVFAPIWIQKSFGPWTTYGGGGYWYEPGADHQSFYRVGWLVQRDLNEHLTLGTEIYHETNGNLIEGPAHTAFNVGGYYNFDEHRHLLFSVGRDIQGQNKISSYLGFQLTW